MKSLKLIGLAFGASLALSTAAFAQDITIAVAGPMTGGESAFGRQMKNGAEHGGRRHQRRRRRARQEAGAGSRRRRLRSEAGALGRRKDREREDPVRRRPLLLVVVDPGLGSLCRRQRAADHAGLDQSAVHRAQALERGARLRPRRPAGPGRRATTSPRTYKGKNVAILNDKTTYGKGLADETKKALNKAGVTGEDVRVLQQGRQGLQRDRLAPEARQHRSGLCRRLSSGSRPDPAPDARPGPARPC